jgi:glycosyltransferase involved in cell wall biosynthesis
MSNYPPVSVIIPVYNDAERLKLCLGALENQTYPDDRYEVIVIDNGSDEPLDDLVSQFPHAQLTHEAKPGSYSARNKGLTVAKHDYLAFTDSDCIPDAAWLSCGVWYLVTRLDVDLIGGKVEIFYTDPDYPTAVELFERVFAFPMRIYVEKDHYTPTCNMFTRRSVFKHIGLFDGDLKSGGDKEWGIRAYQRGHQIIYAEDVVVQHPARRTFAELMKKQRRTTAGNVKLIEERTGRSVLLTRKFHVLFIPPVRKTMRVFKRQDMTLLQRLKVFVTMIRVRISIIFRHIHYSIRKPSIR